jgi:hypothetical protein
MAVVTVAATVSLGAVAALKQLRQQLSLVSLAIYSKQIRFILIAV